MRASVAYGLILGCVFAALSGCGSFQKEQRAAWRGEAELVCLKRGLIVPTAFTRPLEPVNGPGVCGLDRPFRIYAANDGATGVQPAAKLGCPLAAGLNEWMTSVVQPAALARFGAQVAEIKNMASYGCRTRNNRPGGKLSEHSFGNGLDIAGFVLTDVREVTVKTDWRRGPPEAQAFLREVHGGACGIFKTVLGPGSDRFHEDHFHFDLARHNAKGSAYCRPRPAAPEPARAPAPLEPPPFPSQDADEMLMSYSPAERRWPAFVRPRAADPVTTGSVSPPLDLLDGDPEDFGAHE
jgi:hypothetical protein